MMAKSLEQILALALTLSWRARKGIDPLLPRARASGFVLWRAEESGKAGPKKPSSGKTFEPPKNPSQDFRTAADWPHVTFYFITRCLLESPRYILCITYTKFINFAYPTHVIYCITYKISSYMIYITSSPTSPSLGESKIPSGQCVHNYGKIHHVD